MRLASSNEMSDYGFNTIIRNYCGFPKMLTLPCHIEHGWTPLDEPLVTDLKTDKDLILVFSKRRKKAWEIKTKKQIFIIGAPFILFRKMHDIQKDANAKGTIAFPDHSATFIESKFEINTFCEKLNKLPQEFQPVIICLHSDDIQRGVEEKYVQNGFKVVTAGSRYDSNFARNFYDLLKKNQYSTSNSIGSFTFYSIEMDIPFFITGDLPLNDNPNKIDPNYPAISTIIDFPIGKKAYDLFNTGPTKEILPEQIEFVSEEVGFKDYIKAEELNRILIKIYFKRRFKEIIKFIPSQIINFVRHFIKIIIKKIIRTNLFNKLLLKLLPKLPNYSSAAFSDNIFLIDKVSFNYYSKGIEKAVQFNFENLSNKTISYINKLNINDKIGLYKYSYSSFDPSIYSSVFAVNTLSLYGKIKNIDLKQKEKWVKYLNSFQSESDGLFYDPTVQNNIFCNSDWWGARHLALLTIMALNNLGFLPKYKLKFLENYYAKSNITSWLDSFDWEKITYNDFDNKVMNIGCLLQYSRDFLDDKRAGIAVNYLIDYLKSKIFPETGMWCSKHPESKNELSKIVQFAYHLYPLFFYDNREIKYKETLIDNILLTQNIMGGFGVTFNSSACEDIDSIDLLIRLSKLTDYRSYDIANSLKKTLPWVLSNMNKDGGFVFRRNKTWRYGHQRMSAMKNESCIFSTWFRTLSIAYITKFLGLEQGYFINKIPGYEF